MTLTSTARRALAAGGLVAIAALAGCGSPGAGGGTAGHGGTSILIALNVPASSDQFLASAITRGAGLAVAQANAAGVKVGGTRYTVALKSYDDGGQAQQAANNVGAAIHDGAVAVIEDGYGAGISAPQSGAAGVPEIVLDQHDINLLDPVNRPSLFRLGIPDDSAAHVLAAYMEGKTTRVAIIHDDTASGRDGATNMQQGLTDSGVTAAPIVEVAAGAPTMDAQIQQVVAAHPGGIVIWGGDAFTGRTVAAIRAAGVTTPLYAGPDGEFPAVRQIAGIAASNGLVFVSSRLTSEGDNTSFPKFEHALAAAEGGPMDAGFKDAQGQEIRQPDDYAMYAYDAVNVVLAALQKQGSVHPTPRLFDTMCLVSVTSANGDMRGFNSQNHEGIADDDMYIAVIHDMQFQPVRDEPLSATLPTENQILADFH